MHRGADAIKGCARDRPDPFETGAEHVVHESGTALQLGAHRIGELAVAMSSSALRCCGTEFASVAEPWTGLGYPICAVIFWALSRLVMNFRKSTASAAFLLPWFTMNPSGAPVRAFLSPGASVAAGSRKKSQLLATSFVAPPLVVSAGNSTSSR